MEVFFSTSALIVSLISLLISIWLWRESNRPVVSVRIRTHKGGNVGIVYNIEMVNSGARPARNVRLLATRTELERALAMEARKTSDFENEFELVMRCFEPRAVVPILLNGETVSNSFGHTSKVSPFWKPGAIIQLRIEYEGMEGQSYNSKAALKIDDTAGFAGSFYGSSEER